MMRPSIGARFVCTSKIDKKIPIRRVFVFKTWFSSDSVMSITVPSAAATIRFGSAGTVRSGSRKNATVNRNSSEKSSAIHTDSNTLATVSRAKNAKIQRASKSVWRRIKGHHFRNSEQRGQGTKMTKNGLNAEP